MIISNLKVKNKKLYFELKLAEIETSDIQFYLTGSRAFGTEKENSDWDFFVQDTTYVRQWLISHGFYPFGADYDDKQTIAVFCEEQEIALARINIQLVENVEIKILAQEIFKEFRFYLEDKNQRKALWDRIFRIIELSKKHFGVSTDA